MLDLFLQRLSAFAHALQSCPERVAMVADAAAVRMHKLLG